MRKALPALVLSSVAVNAGATELGAYRCAYGAFSDGVVVQAPEQSFELAFIVDEEGSATVLGNNGSASVYLVQAGSGEGVTFIEVTAAGSVMTTAIASNGSSAHSRNTIIDGDIVPSQYYGHCEAR